MIDNEFDGFVNGKLGDHEVPVPAGLWDKLTNAQFDQFIGNKLKDAEAPVPEGAWDKIADGQFDDFVGSRLSGAEATVPAGLWDRVSDGQFDSFISGKLSGAEAAVPAGLWEKVNPQKDDDDRGGFAWLRNPGRAIAVAAVLIALLGGYFWFQSSDENNTNTPDTTAVSSPGGAPATINKNDGGAVIDPPDQGSANNATAATNETTGNREQQTVQPGAQAGAVSSDLRVQGNGRGNQSTNFSSPQRNAATNHNQGSGGANGVAPGLISSNVNNSNNNNNTAIAGEVPENTTQTAINEFEFIEPYQQNHLQAGTTIPFAGSGRSTNLADKHLSAGNHLNQVKSSIIVCPSDKGLNKDWFLEAYLSPDFAFSKASSNGASQAYMDRKDSSESMNPGFSAGIRLVKPLTDNILLKAGLQYSQMNQKYVYRTENEIKTITVVSLRTIIRAPGDTVIVRDTSVLQQAGYKNNTVINRFRSLDVPITVGYQFGDDDLKIGINAGVVVNMSSWYEGVTLDTSFATVPVPKGSANTVYKNRIGLGLIGGISITKKLSEDLHLFAEPYFRYNLSNTTTPNAPFNQKFSIGGIQLGVRLNLNRQ